MWTTPRRWLTSASQGGTRSLVLNEITQDPEVVGASRGHSRSTVHSGLSQCSSGLSISSSPDPGLRMDPSCGRLSGSESSVASDGGPICHLSKSPLRIPSGILSRLDRCISPVVGRSSGLRIPSLVRHSPGPGEAALFLGDLSDISGSALASEAMVSRAPGIGGGSSGDFAIPPGLLFQPLSGLRYLGLLRLRLHAWRLSGYSLVQPVSPPV